MASVTHRVATASTSNVTSYASGSFTPGAGEVLVAFVYASGTAATGTMTDSQGLGFTKVTGESRGTSADALYAFVSNAAAAASAMTVTFDCTGDAATGALIFVAGVSSLTRTGISAVKQFEGESNRNAGSGSPEVVFASSVLTGNPTLMFMADGDNPPAVTPPTGWTEPAGGDTGFASPAVGGEYNYRNSGFTGTTVTWASAAATNWGSIGLELDTSSAAQTVTPTTAALTLTTFAPTIAHTIVGAAPTALTLSTFAPTVAHKIVGAAPTALTLTTFAPTIAHTIVGAAPTALTTTTFAPTIAHVINAASPTALTLTTFAPTVSTTAHLTVTPTTAALTLTTFAPVIALQIIPSTASLSTATFAPTVTASDHQLVTPTTASLTLTTFAPTISASSALTVTPDTAALVLTLFAPTVTASDHQTVTPSTASLSTATFAPTVTASDHKTVTPTTASLTTAAFAPTVTATNHQLVTPGPAAIISALFAPTVTASDHKVATPTTASLTLTTFAPDVVAHEPDLIQEPEFWLARFGRSA